MPLSLLIRRRMVWGGILGVGVSLAIAGEGVRAYWTQRREWTRLQARRLEVQHRLAEREARLALAEGNEDYIEILARRELGLLRPGEIEFRFGSDADITSVSPVKEN
jgi:cell division protein FtsB